jgi:hypothetical protein
MGQLQKWWWKNHGDKLRRRRLDSVRKVNLQAQGHLRPAQPESPITPV